MLAFFGYTRFREVTWVPIGKTVYFPRCVTDPFDPVYIPVVKDVLTNGGTQTRLVVFVACCFFLLPVGVILIGLWFILR